MIEKRFSVRIEDRTAELIIMGVPTSVVLERVPLTTESIEKLETLLAVAKQVLTGNVRKDAEVPSLWKVETKEAAG